MWFHPLVLLVAAVWIAWLFHGPTVGAASPPGAAERVKGPIADFCRGSQACRQVVMFRSGGAMLLRVTFFDPNLFVDEGDGHCGSREYGYISGQDRKLVTRDCAEQWGRGQPGPSRPVIRW
jgi:hypothetical protein